MTELFAKVGSFQASPLMRKGGSITTMIQHNLDVLGKETCRDFTEWLSTTNALKCSIYDGSFPDGHLDEIAQLKFPQEAFNKALSWATQTHDDLLVTQLSFVHSCIMLSSATARAEVVAKETLRPKVHGEVCGPTGEQVTPEQGQALKDVRAHFNGFTTFKNASFHKLVETPRDDQTHLDIAHLLFSKRTAEQICEQVRRAFHISSGSKLRSPWCQ